VYLNGTRTPEINAKINWPTACYSQRSFTSYRYN